MEPAFRVQGVAGAPDRQALLVGNTRALWPHFLAGADLAQPDPLDQWVESVVRSSLQEHSAPEHTVYFPHEPPPRRLPFQRLAELARFAPMGPGMLLVHPEFGPWVSLRALIVLDEPAGATPPLLPALEGAWKQPVQQAFDAAMSAASGAPKQADVINSWRRWVQVRDAFPQGRQHRFSAHQIRYHYTRDTRWLRYQPAYCEENVLMLAQDPRLRSGQAVFITNSDQAVACWDQRASERPDGLVAWDYHVVLICDGQVWDHDCRSGMPLSIENWLACTFPHEVSPRFTPLFRVVPAAQLLTCFASDRSHMRLPDGGWRAPPPPWPPFGQGHNLPEFLDLTRPAPGRITDRAGLSGLFVCPSD